MSMELMCPVCGMGNWFNDEDGGSKGTCGKCKAPIYVPRRDEMPTDAEIRIHTGGHWVRGVLTMLCVGVLALLALGGGGVALYFLFPWKTAVANQSKDSFASAETIKVTAAPATQEGTIAQAGDEVIYRFKAAAAGIVSVTFDAADDSKLDGLLQAYDDKKKEIAHNDGDADSRTSQIIFPVKNDSEYFVKLTGFDASSGKFKVTLQNSASLAGDFASALKIRLSRTGAAGRTFRMERVGDENAFEFVAPVTGWMFAEMGTPPGGNLDGFIDAFDDTRTKIQPESDGLRSQGIRFAVNKGKTYYVKALSHLQTSPGWGRSGLYSISMRTVKAATDDFGNDFHTASKLNVDAFAPTTQMGQIENDLDVDMLVFQAPKSGSLTVSVNPAAPAAIEAYAMVFDAGKKMMNASPVDYRTFTVVANQTYYVKVAPSSLTPQPGRSRTGAYALQLAFNNSSNNADFASATQVNFFLDQATVAGQIVEPDRAVYYKFVAPKSCLMQVDLTIPLSSSLDANVTAYNSNLTPINNVLGTTSFVDFNVIANQTYYIKVNSKTFPDVGRLRTGSFSVKFNGTQKIGAAPNEFDNAKTVALDLAGAADVADEISDPNGGKLFRLVAPNTGIIKVDLTMPASASVKLSARLTCLDATKFAIGPPTGSLPPVDFPVSAGKTYFVKVVPSFAPPLGSQKTGSFTAKFRFEKKPSPDSTEFGSAKLVPLGAAGAGEIADQISDGPKCYQFVPAKGGFMTVNLEVPKTSKLDARINVYDADRLAVLYTGEPTSVTFFVEGGKTYYVKILPQVSLRKGFEKTGSFTAMFQLDK